MRADKNVSRNLTAQAEKIASEAKRLNKIFDSALWNLKHCIA
ncbi:hypothetical protein [uncultured Duncaniella sp.]|jgi:hypothetical protein|nr:hypothetical protein [uncultured Duncaniella sp.]